MWWGAEARALHDQGRQLVAEQKFDLALQSYKACVERLQQPDALQGSASMQEDHAKLLTTGLANSALCCLKLELWAEAEEACTHCLQLDADSAKARGRRGLARTKLAAAGDLSRVEPAHSDLTAALKVDPQDGLLLRVLEQLEGIRNGSSAPAGDGFSFSRALSAADKRSSKSEEKKQAPTPTNDASFGYEIWHANRLKWMGMTEKEEALLPDDLSSQESWDDDEDEIAPEEMSIRRVLEAKSHFPPLPSSMPLGKVMRVARRLWDE
jgi:tetratricopeptide (TPR) repeat protein